MNKTISILIALVLLLAFVNPVHADIAPPAQPPGANLLPGNETTQVRMVSEKVLIDVQKTTPANSLGQARVSAEFHMLNLGDTSETMAVRFPISANDGWSNYPEIAGFTVKVDGKLVPTRKIASAEGEQLKWAEFDASFDPGIEVNIEVSYVLEGSGEYPYIAFSYLLSTGAGWKDTIGSIEAIVRLPYEINNQNVFIDGGCGWGDTTPGAVIEGQELRWEYTDYEPAQYDNILVAMVMPSSWQKVLTERSNVERNPRDGEAWGRLGKIYKEISRLRRETRYDSGGPILFELSKEAYEKALELLPDDALWHAGYAELIFDNYYWLELSSQQKPGMLLALQEMSTAVQLKPNDPFIVELLDEMRYALGDAIQVDDNQVMFTWLTATPTFSPTRLETLVTLTQIPPTSFPTITSTMNSAATITSTPEPKIQASVESPAAGQPSSTQTTKSPFSVCSGIVVLPMLVALVAWRRRKKE